MSEDNPTGKEVTGIIVAIACVAHETLRAYASAMGDEIPAWENAPQWQVQAAIDGVGYHLSNPNATPEDSHKNWVARKVRDGWAYSPVRDDSLKLHECMCPYDELDQKQKVKDFLFKSNVDTLAKVFGVEQV